MDLALLENPTPDNLTLPPGVDAALWGRYLKGAKSVDDLYSKGARCPRNPAGARCACDIPGGDYCRYFSAVFKIALQVGGATAQLVKEMT